MALDINLVEDIYPASYLQMGMLLESSLNNKGTYHDVFSYSINSRFNGNVSKYTTLVTLLCKKKIFYPKHHSYFLW